MLDADISGDSLLEENFIPYIQLHEFEALLFSDIAVIDRVLSVGRKSKYAELADIRKQYDPEDINTRPTTTPSKRLKQLCPRCSKTMEGMVIAERIGLPAIRNCCPHFDGWLRELEVVAVSRESSANYRRSCSYRSAAWLRTSANRSPPQVSIPTTSGRSVTRISHTTSAIPSSG